MDKLEEKQLVGKGKKCSSWPVGVWDCESTLYDSYELNSFKLQIHSAIANSPVTVRSLSMSHLPERRRPLSPLLVPNHNTLTHPPSPSSKSFKIPRTFQKLLRFVFNKSTNPRARGGPSITNNFEIRAADQKYSNFKEPFYVVYDKYSDQPVLTTIPELPEIEIAGGGGLSPEISSLVTKSASQRFTPTPIGISCA